MHRQDPQPVVEVRAKTAGGDGLSEVAIRRRNNAHVDGNVGARSDAPHGALLQDSQQFGLGRKVQRIYFIEKECASRRFFKQTATALMGAGESTAFVAKQFGFDE